MRGLDTFPTTIYRRWKHRDICVPRCSSQIPIMAAIAFIRKSDLLILLRWNILYRDSSGKHTVTCLRCLCFVLSFLQFLILVRALVPKLMTKKYTDDLVLYLLGFVDLSRWWTFSLRQTKERMVVQRSRFVYSTFRASLGAGGLRGDLIYVSRFIYRVT